MMSATCTAAASCLLFQVNINPAYYSSFYLPCSCFQDLPVRPGAKFSSVLQTYFLSVISMTFKFILYDSLFICFSTMFTVNIIFFHTANVNIHSPCISVCADLFVLNVPRSIFTICLCNAAAITTSCRV